MKKEKKVIRHRFLDNRSAIVGMMLLTLLAFTVIFVVIGLVFGAVVGVVTTVLDINASDTMIAVVYIVASFIMLAIHKRWFYPEFDGCLKVQKDLGKWLLVTAGLLLAMTLPDYIITLMQNGKIVAPTFTALQTSLLAGVSEEVVFRAVPASFGMRQIKEAKKIPAVVITTSAVFALVHATNVFAGAPADSTIMQVLVTFGIGALFCALFLRSGNIITAMLLHFLYDVYALMHGSSSVSETGVIVSHMDFISVVSNVIILVVTLGLTAFLLRKSVQADVMALWQKKWHKNEATGEMAV